MRKIPSELDNPIDNVYLRLADTMNPIYKSMNFTPNHITLLSAITGALSVWCLIKQKYALSAVLHIISYIFDCMDGHYARTYDMVTTFGDIFDHVKDLIHNGIALYLMFNKTYHSNYPWLFAILPISIVLTQFQMGCQEKYYDSKDFDMMTMTKQFCPAKNKSELKKYMHITRYFGAGTTNLVTAAYIAMLPYILS